MGLVWLIGIILFIKVGGFLISCYTPRSELRAKIEQQKNEITNLMTQNKFYEAKYGELEQKIENLVRQKLEMIEKHQNAIETIEHQKQEEMCEYKDDIVDVIEEHYRKEFDYWVENYKNENVKK